MPTSLVAGDWVGHVTASDCCAGMEWCVTAVGQGAATTVARLAWPAHCCSTCVALWLLHAQPASWSCRPVRLVRPTVCQADPLGCQCLISNSWFGDRGAWPRATDVQLKDQGPWWGRQWGWGLRNLSVLLSSDELQSSVSVS